uniref:LMBR1 domain-containing protein 2 n=1 Tax=Syphacia muris TaxID=451379 RepID=A0A0N5ALM3_9BILA
MDPGLLIFELVFVFCLTVILLNKYGNWRKQHFIVTLSTFVGWYFSFIIIFILPLDIAITFYYRCLYENDKMKELYNTTIFCKEPDGFVEDYVLRRMWRFVYWTAQLLTWQVLLIILPLMQSYSNAGDFTAFGRFRSAVYNNVIYYGVYVTVFVILLIYVAFKGVSLNAEHLKVILISASNTWGLFLLVVLLGYGLIEVPRQLWQLGDRGYRLRKTYFDIDKLSTDKNETEDTLYDVYREARSALSMLRNEHILRGYAQAILAKFSPDLVSQITALRSTSATVSNLPIDEQNFIANESYLISLHRRVIKAIINHHRTQAQWNALINLALHLENVEQAECTGQFVRLDNLRSSKIFCNNRFEYIWHVILKPRLLKIISIAFFGMTAFIMWSECTFFVVHPTLSLASKVVAAAAMSYHYLEIQMWSMAIIAYLCICAYYTVFKLRIYRYYHLDPHHMTDENSLLFSAILLCRLTPPICLNALGMIHLDSHITADTEFGVETQFTNVFVYWLFMGHLDVIPILAKGLNIYLPILIVLLCLGTWFRLGTRFLHNLGIDQFVGDDEMTSDMISGGKALVSLERNKIVRASNRKQRDQYWAEKLAELNNTRGSQQRLAQEPVGERWLPANEMTSEEDRSVTLFEGDSKYPLFSSYELFQQPMPGQDPPLPSNVFDDL